MAIKPMDALQGFAIGAATAILPTCFVFLAGLTHSWTTGLYCAAAWMGAYLAWNVGIVDQQDWQCIERLGQFWRIKRSGIVLYCALGIIDKVKAKGNLKERKIGIFEDEKTPSKHEELDFIDGSAPIEGYVWYKNGRDNGTMPEIQDDIISFVYASDNPTARLVEIVEDRLRPSFQNMTVDTASAQRARVVEGEVAEIKNEILGYGLYLAKQPPIVIADIGLTVEQMNLRQERMRGRTAADGLEAEAAGYRKAIEAIMYSRDTNGAVVDQVCDFETAKQIWENQQTRGTIAKTGANVTIFGKSADKIVKNFNTN